MRQGKLKHFAYFIKSPNLSVVHVVDAVSRDKESKGEFGDYWDSYDGLDPDFLFIGAAGHHTRMMLYSSQYHLTC